MPARTQAAALQVAGSDKRSRGYRDRTTVPALWRFPQQVSGQADYSLLRSINGDLDATSDGEDYQPREVFSGHYVPIKPTPIAAPEYVAHSRELFRELNLDDSLAQSEGFRRLFSGDLSQVPPHAQVELSSVLDWPSQIIPASRLAAIDNPSFSHWSTNAS